VKLCATAPLCNILGVSFSFYYSVFIRAHIFPLRTSRAGAEYGACVSGAPQQHCKTQRIRALAHEHALMPVTSPKELWPGGLLQNPPPHLRTFGTYSPREAPMRKPISAHEFHYHVLLWSRLFNLHREQESPQGLWSRAPNPEGKAHHQGTNATHEAKTSLS
jgi:hypothetical protein